MKNIQKKQRIRNHLYINQLKKLNKEYIRITTDKLEKLKKLKKKLYYIQEIFNIIMLNTNNNIKGVKDLATSNDKNLIKGAKSANQLKAIFK